MEISDFYVGQRIAWQSSSLDANGNRTVYPATVSGVDIVGEEVLVLWDPNGTQGVLNKNNFKDVIDLGRQKIDTKATQVSMDDFLKQLEPFINS